MERCYMMSSTIRKHVRHQKIIVIGASTGGPKALQQVLQDLPTTFVIPILIAQHMPKKFTASFAERLNRHSHLHVKEATDEEIIQEGTVYLGPGDQHMMVHRND